MQIRDHRPDDAEAIRRIYNYEVEHGTGVFELVPRTIEQQRAWLGDRSGAHRVVVATDDDDAVIGFASLSRYRERPAYNTTVEDSVYVGTDHRGRGVGAQLLGNIVEIARHHGFHTVIGRVAAENEASVALHTHHGFQIVGREIEVGRKFGRWLDVVVLQRLL